ncbi:MAG: tRNA (adenosine(37)-N6)-threonylcarbamoyltransferase complex dimerization subunit type 1 TsaB [Candidatus Nitrospinota bacterium M3_3B_026]
MRILGIDTSSIETNLALMDDGLVEARASRKPSRTHSREILKTLQTMLEEADAPLESVDLVAVSSGPGSFTGLRIGLGTALGLGAALDVPVTGVGTLDAMARVQPLWDGGYLVPILNARMGEVYAALYTAGEKRWEKATDDLAAGPETLAGMIDRPARFVGGGFAPYSDLFRERIGAGIDAVAEAPARTVSEGAAMIAYEEALAGRTGKKPPAPRYVRRPQAEINWERQRAEQNEGGRYAG